MSKIKRGDLPEVNDKGFFQLFHDCTINGKNFKAGAWFKLLNAGRSNSKSWTVRPKYWNDKYAMRVPKDLLRKK